MANEVLTARDGAVLTITLNRPDVFNAFNRDVHAALRDALEEAGDDEIRAVVITGAGRGFCSGQDLKEFSDLPDGAIRGALEETYHPNIRLIRSLQKPVLAAVNGAAAGAGISLAAACDVRVGSSNAVIGLPAVEEGLFPGMAPYRLPRLIGKGRAASLILTGRSLTAEEAERIGLIDHVVDAEDFDAQLAGLVDEYARAPREAAAASKRLMALSYDAPFEEALHTSEELLQSCLRAPEVARARAAWPQRATRR
jgi:enoyl-CoA hydratase/carnithine racemase